MKWPTSQDYNEAIQNAASSFADPALKSGEATVNAIGLPVPRSGNFADVYQFKGGDGKTWALKCFTRKIAGLQERYAKIDEHIAKANFPFTVGFKYLAEGIRVGGEWFPVLKMEWVEGFTLNEFIRDNAGKPQYLHALMQMWGKLTARLRDGNFAHADLQHGNVLLVPGDAQNKLGLKLIDYDGMWVPSLAEYHSGEIGHPNFQHPLRLKDRLYNADVDRFPHLVIACALRGALIGGRAFWNKFDNGDNLLFKEVDLRDPAKAPVFKALWDLKDDILCTLVGKLALASREPLRKTPWLDDILLEEGGLRLTPDEEKKVIEMLGVAPHFTAVKPVEVAAAVHAPVADEYSDFEVVDDEEDQRAAERRARKKNKKTRNEDEDDDRRNDRYDDRNESRYDDRYEPRKKARKEKPKSLMPFYIGGGVLAAVLAIGAIIAVTAGGNKNTPAKPQAASTDNRDTSSRVTTVGPSRKKDIPDDSNNVEITPKDPFKDPPKVEKKDPADDPPPPIIPKKEPAGTSKEPEKDVPSSEFKEMWQTNTPGIASFSADNKKVSLGAFGSIQTYSIKDGTPSDLSRISNQAFSGYTTLPDGSYLILAPIGRFGQQELYSWDSVTKLRRFAIDDQAALFQLIQVATKANLVLLGQKTGGLAFYSLTDGKKVDSITLPTTQRPISFSCTEDGEAVLAYVFPNQVYFRPKKGAPVKPPFRIDPSEGTSVRLSPDGKLFIQYGGARNAIQVYETTAGNKQLAMEGHSSTVRHAAFTADGRHVFSVGDSTLRVWETESGREIKQVGLPGSAISMAISPDGQHALTVAGPPVTMQIWRLPDVFPAVVAVKPKMPVEAAVADPPVPAITEVWNVKGYAVKNGLAFRNDGSEIIATPGTPREVRSYDAKTGEPLRSFPVSDSAVMSIAACPDDLLVVCDDMARLALWDLKTRTIVAPFPVTPGSPYAVSVAGDSGKVWVANQTTTIGQVNLSDGKTSFTYRLRTDDVIIYLVSTANGLFNVAINAKGDVFTRTPTSVLFKPSGKLADVHHVSLSPDGKTFLAAGTKGYLRLCDTETGNEQRAFEGHQGEVLSAVMSRNSKFVLSVAGDKTLRVWNAETGKQVQEIKLAGVGMNVAISPDGKFAVTSTANTNAIQLWRLPSELAP